MDSSHQVTDTTKQRPPPSLHIQTGQMDYKKVSIWCWNVPSNHWQWQLWENSKLHNVQLQKELNEVKSDLESVRSQLETMAIRVSGHWPVLYLLLYSVSYDLIDYKIFKAGTIWQYKTFPGRESEIGIWCWEERKIDCHKEARGIGERTEGLIIHCKHRNFIDTPAVIAPCIFREFDRPGESLTVWRELTLASVADPEPTQTGK